MQVKNIVVVGGGAGGLELATKLGKKFHKTDVNIFLVDKKPTHIWKPLLHEVATGIMDSNIDEIHYLSCAYNSHFQFELGSFCGLNKEEKKIYLDEVKSHDGLIVAPKRTLDYDILVLAVGSISNDFGTEGVRENCLFLDSLNQAQLLHSKILDIFMQFSNNSQKDYIDIGIVGAGATGVELCAELNNSIEKLYSYGYKNLTNQNVRIKLIEAGDRVLPALSVKLSSNIEYELKKLNVEIKTNTIVSKASSEGFYTKEGELIKSDLLIWTAGVKAPDFLTSLNLEVDRINRLVVKCTLQATQDDNIFVIGDCASCIDKKGKQVPPRAQSAHQMADLCFQNIQNIINDKKLDNYEYKDHGFLVSLSKYSTVGSLAKPIGNGFMMIEGFLARLSYLSLYRMHQITILGFIKTGIVMLVDSINKLIRPKVKLKS